MRETGSVAHATSLEQLHEPYNDNLPQYAACLTCGGCSAMLFFDAAEEETLPLPNVAAAFASADAAAAPASTFFPTLPPFALPAALPSAGLRGAFGTRCAFAAPGLPPSDKLTPSTPATALSERMDALPVRAPGGRAAPAPCGMPSRAEPYTSPLACRAIAECPALPADCAAVPDVLSPALVLVNALGAASVPASTGGRGNASGETRLGGAASGDAVCVLAELAAAAGLAASLMRRPSQRSTAAAAPLWPALAAVAAGSAFGRSSFTCGGRAQVRACAHLCHAPEPAGSRLQI